MTEITTYVRESTLGSPDEEWVKCSNLIAAHDYIISTKLVKGEKFVDIKLPNGTYCRHVRADHALTMLKNQ